MSALDQIALLVDKAGGFSELVTAICDLSAADFAPCKSPFPFSVDTDLPPRSIVSAPLPPSPVPVDDCSAPTPSGTSGSQDSTDPVLFSGYVIDKLDSPKVPQASVSSSSVPSPSAGSASSDHNSNSDSCSQDSVSLLSGPCDFCFADIPTADPPPDGLADAPTLNASQDSSVEFLTPNPSPSDGDPTTILLSTGGGFGFLDQSPPPNPSNSGVASAKKRRVAFDTHTPTRFVYSPLSSSVSSVSSSFFGGIAPEDQSDSDVSDGSTVVETSRRDVPAGRAPRVHDEIPT